MFLGLTIVGWILLVFLYWPLVGGILLLVRWMFDGASRRTLTVLIGCLGLILGTLPFWDALWIDWHFKRACEGAGVFVDKKVVADGYLNEVTKAFVSNTGFKFVESMESNGRVLHLEIQGGQVVSTYLDSPRARYRYSRRSLEPGYGLIGREDRITDSEKGEVLGREIAVGAYPGFFERLTWYRYIGKGPVRRCFESSWDFIDQVLVPSGRQNKEG